MKPYFSIIIPTHSINDFLRKETLPSLMVQSFKSFDCFIVTNKPSPEHKQLMRKYPFLKIISDSERTKPGEKRDLAAARSEAHILAFIDDDVFPPPQWLKNAHRLFEADKKIFGLAGPGILPNAAPFFEQVGDAVLRTWVGSGAYTYRFISQRPRYVDDYPTMNLMMQRSIFISIGGFDNKHWPGEDSKLLNKLSDHKQVVYYHPDAVVFHHRRDTLKGHLEQHKNYGKTRGRFAAEGDKNSRSIMYVVPALFVLYLVLFTIMLLQNQLVAILISIPGVIYMFLLLYVFWTTFLQKGNIILAAGASILIPLTHITYGLFFIKGFLTQKMSRFISQ